MGSDACVKCGKAAALAPCYTRESEKHHYECIMISLPLEKPIALEEAIHVDSLRKFQRKIVDVHNKLRKQHGCPELEWSKKCEQHAKQWVRYLLKKNKGMTPDELELEHDDYAGMGENIYIQSVPGTIRSKQAAKLVSYNWYGDESKYDYDSNEYNKDAAHFSQLVWKGSWKIGAAYGQIDDLFVVVANYWPAGNIKGWFLDHVPKRIE